MVTGVSKPDASTEGKAASMLFDNSALLSSGGVLTTCVYARVDVPRVVVGGDRKHVSARRGHRRTGVHAGRGVQRETGRQRARTTRSTSRCRRRKRTSRCRRYPPMPEGQRRIRRGDTRATAFVIAVIAAGSRQQGRADQDCDRAQLHHSHGRIPLVCIARTAHGAQTTGPWPFSSTVESAP